MPPKKRKATATKTVTKTKKKVKGTNAKRPVPSYGLDRVAPCLKEDQPAAFPSELMARPPSSSTYVVFHNRIATLCWELAQADGIFGCCAWLTNRSVLDVLVGKTCSIVVQKEKWETKHTDTEAYSKLGQFDYNGLTWQSGSAPIPHVEPNSFRLTQLTGQTDVIRCFGYVPKKTEYDNRLMHHKFLVLCKRVGRVYTPYAVWLGSANLTALTERHSEACLFLTDPAVAYEYAKAWARHFFLSEPIAWTSRELQPTLYQDYYHE